VNGLAVPGPSSAQALAAAREAVLAALAESTSTAGHHAARAVLAVLSGADLLEVAVILAALLARPADLILTDAEWAELAARWGLEP
jgi:hypothetical protein